MATTTSPVELAVDSGAPTASTMCSLLAKSPMTATLAPNELTALVRLKLVLGARSSTLESARHSGEGMAEGEGDGVAVGNTASLCADAERTLSSPGAEVLPKRRKPYGVAPAGSGCSTQAIAVRLELFTSADISWSDAWPRRTDSSAASAGARNRTWT